MSQIIFISQFKESWHWKIFQLQTTHYWRCCGPWTCCTATQCSRCSRCCPPTAVWPGQWCQSWAPEIFQFYNLRVKIFCSSSPHRNTHRSSSSPSDQHCHRRPQYYRPRGILLEDNGLGHHFVSLENRFSNWSSPFLTYHQHGHIIGVASVTEPAEGADVIPTIERRGEGSPTERGAGWRSTGPCGMVAVEGGAPAGQGLGLALL